MRSQSLTRSVQKVGVYNKVSKTWNVYKWLQVITLCAYAQQGYAFGRVRLYVCIFVCIFVYMYRLTHGFRGDTGYT